MHMPKNIVDNGLKMVTFIVIHASNYDIETGHIQTSQPNTLGVHYKCISGVYSLCLIKKPTTVLSKVA
ncbi:hypothetical protein BDB01DRAFT_778917 [Pilobolus umbonatus]|nr:hypothetical protein BDB01DRAFT_778917 [Pilobolus umbonatus]